MERREKGELRKALFTREILSETAGPGGGKDSLGQSYVCLCVPFVIIKIKWNCFIRAV